MHVGMQLDSPPCKPHRASPAHHAHRTPTPLTMHSHLHLSPLRSHPAHHALPLRSPCTCTSPPNAPTPLTMHSHLHLSSARVTT